MPFTPAPFPATAPATHDFFGGLLAAGFAGLLIGAVLIVAGFFISAWLGGLWLRLLVRLHRGFFDREYARLMGRYLPSKADRPRGGPRDW